MHFFTALQRARPGSLNLGNLLDAEVGFLFVFYKTAEPPSASSSPRGGMPRSQQPRFEEAGGHRLPLGGLYGYIGPLGSVTSSAIWNTVRLKSKAINSRIATCTAALSR